MSKGEAAAVRMNCSLGSEKPSVEQSLLVGEEWGLKLGEMGRSHDRGPGSKNTDQVNLTCRIQKCITWAMRNDLGFKRAIKNKYLI